MWVRMMAPITPHIAEEVWESLGNEDFVSIAPYPEAIGEDIDIVAEVAESYLGEVMADVNEILKVTGIALKRIILYTTPQWKRDVLDLALDMSGEDSLTVPSLPRQSCLART